MSSEVEVNLTIWPDIDVGVNLEKKYCYVTTHDYKTFIHDLVVLTVFLFTAFSCSFCISSTEISEKLAAIFWKTKAKT